MILFLSDIHFGRLGGAAERESETALLACLRAHEDAAERLYLVGDVFDQYIEYRHLIPKGFVRFQALLAEWTDRGVPVTYLAGNHDPWHRSYFEDELGVRVVFDAVVEPLCGANVYLAHGDEADPTTPLYSWLRPVLRHPVPVALYQYLLPGDAGFALARWFNRRFHSDRLDLARVAGLRDHARHVLCTTQADFVVMGHSHQPELRVWPEGCYLNPGTWYEHRTFGTLGSGGAALLRWNGTRAVAIESPATQRALKRTV